MCACVFVCVCVCVQLSEARGEVEKEHGRSRELQIQLDELQEEVSFQEARSHGDSSLLSELESSLATAEMGLSTEQVWSQKLIL